MVAELADDEEFLSGARAWIGFVDSIAAIEPFGTAADKFRSGRFGTIAETDALTVVVAVAMADEAEVFSPVFAFLAVDFFPGRVGRRGRCLRGGRPPCCNVIPLDRSPAAIRIGDCALPSTGEAAPHLDPQKRTSIQMIRRLLPRGLQASWIFRSHQGWMSWKPIHPRVSTPLQH